jgi:signal transduction histidine kinase
MHISSTKGWMVASGMLGYFFLHPLVMLTARFMSASVRHADKQALGLFVDSIRASFTLEMLPWGLAFSLLSALLGYMFVRQRQVQTQEARLQGVLELAGAACHELNQPLQVVMGYAYLLADEVEKHAPLRVQLETIIGEIDKMSRILRKIQNITHYETLDYLDGVKIIDIEKASRIEDGMRND